MENENVNSQEINEQEQPTYFDQAEWCFQFFNDEPVVFAWSDTEEEAGDLVITINPHDKSDIRFATKGMSFRLFSRPMSEETRQLREQRKAENQ
jgi:hypothetical protein